MSRAARRSTTSVSLFPFLAVLVSAMGALIFLLILTTSRIRSETLARAERERAAAAAVEAVVPPPAPEPAPSPAIMPELAVPAPAPVDPNVELRQVVAALSDEQSELRERVEAKRRQIADAQQRAAQAAAILRGADEKHRALEENRRQQTATLASLEEVSRQLPAQIEGLVRKIRQVKQTQFTGSSKFAVVPYDGLSGTTRRPIFIECTDKGLRFLPEDILLTPAQIDGYSPRANPVLAGAETLVKYWSARNRMVPESQRDPEPYVLMLVRPSGAMTYYYGRKLLSEFRQPFGYELLDEDQELALPAADPQAAALCRAAIEDALRVRPTLAARATGESSHGGRELRFSPGGGFEVIEEDEHQFGGAGRSAGRSQGLTRNGLGGESGLSPHSPFAEASPGTARGGGGTPNPLRPAESPLGARPEGRRAGAPGTAVAGRGPAAAGQSGTTGEEGQETGASNAGTASTPAPSDSAAAGSPVEGERMPQGVAETATVRSWSTETQPFESLLPGERPGGQAEQGIAETNTASTESGTSTQPSAGGTTGTRAGETTSAAGASGQPGGNPAIDPFAQQPDGFPRFGRSARSARSRPGGGNSRRWGYSSRRATIGFERELPIAVGSDRLQIGTHTVVDLGDGATPEQLLEQVLAGVEQESRTWGRPPDNFYWVPSIRFLVSPGGNRHVERIRGPLSRWGLGSKVEQRLDALEQPAVPSLGTRPVTGGLP